MKLVRMKTTKATIQVINNLQSIIEDEDKDDENKQTLLSIEHPIMHNYFPQH